MGEKFEKLSSSLCGETLKLINNLYDSNRLLHAYLMYDVVFEPQNTRLVYHVKEGKIDSYLLVWKHVSPREACSLHLCGKSSLDMLGEQIITSRRVFMFLYNTDDIKKASYIMSKKGYKILYKNVFVDMAVDEEGLEKPSIVQPVLLTTRDAEAYSSLRESQGRPVGIDEAKRVLSEQRCYGIYENSLLVSVACRYLTLPHVGIVGGVYTRPEYRGKGYATSVTYAITRDTVMSGAVALLHVAQDNYVAIRIYEKLGYRKTGVIRAFVIYGREV